MKKINVLINSAVRWSAYKKDDEYQAWIDAAVAANLWGQPGDYTVEVLDATAELEQQRLEKETLRVVDLDSPNAVMVFLDDFVFQSSETGEIGTTGWSFTNGTLLGAANEQNHPGVVTRSCGTTNNQVASFYPATVSTTTVLRFDEFDRMTWIVAPAAVNADFDVNFGLFTSVADDTPTNGVYVQRLRTDSQFFGVSRQNNQQTRTAALASFTLNAWNKFRIRRISATSVGFSVNDGSEVVLTSNIPAASADLTFGMQVVSGGTARGIKIDFFSMKLLPITR